MLRNELLTTMAGTTAVVIDCGTYQSRIGYSSNPQPHSVILTIVGRSRPKKGCTTNMAYFVGDDADKSRETLSVKHPIECGIVTNWDDMERFLHALIFDKLKAKPEEHPMFIVEPPLNPMCNAAKTAQVMFETFDVPCLCMKPSSEMSLSATGRTTGMVVEIGEGMCAPVPVFEGYLLARHVPKTMISGNELTYHMLKLVYDKKSLDYDYRQATRIAKDIKENFCYVAMDYEEELRTFSCLEEKHYQLPDGLTINVGKERFQCPEAMFQQTMMGHEMPGLHETVFYTINRCDNDIQSELFSNILLCGGSSLFPGLASRMEKEISQLAGSKRKVQVTASSNIHLAFQGATKLASRDDFLYRCLSKEFYDEYGPGAVERIFFQH